MIIMVTGGRDFDDYDRVYVGLSPYDEPGNILVVGGATGADELARQVWHYDFQLPYIVEPAPWERSGKPAGPMRNMSMVEGLSLVPAVGGKSLHPDVVVAFPGGRGTKHACDYADEKRIEIVYA